MNMGSLGRWEYWTKILQKCQTWPRRVETGSVLSTEGEGPRWEALRCEEGKGVSCFCKQHLREDRSIRCWGTDETKYQHTFKTTSNRSCVVFRSWMKFHGFFEGRRFGEHGRWSWKQRANRTSAATETFGVLLYAKLLWSDETPTRKQTGYRRDQEMGVESLQVAVGTKREILQQKIK